MAKQYMSDQLFEQIYHARSTDPETSHEAVPKNLSGQAFDVLKAYRNGRPMTDMDAYVLAGFERGRLAHQRCSDLRRRKFIKWVDGDLGTSPSGKSAKISKITDAGLAYLIMMEKR